MAMALQLRSKCRTLQNPKLVQLFSSSSDSNGDDDKKESQSRPSFSSYFSDVKASLKQPSPPPKVSPSPSPPRDFPSFSSPKPSKDLSFDEIRKNLSEFRRRSSIPAPDQKSPPSFSSSSSSSSSSPTVLFQDLYKRNVIEKRDEGNNNKSGKLSLDSIRESLRQLRTSNQNQPENDRFGGQDNRSNRVDPYSLKSFRDNLKMRPEGTNTGPQSMVLGGSEVLPPSIFGKESGPKSEAETQALKTEFVKEYSYEELGKKLSKLRPTDANKKFSLEELNERLMKLREMEEKEMDSKVGGVSIKDLREMQRFGLLGSFVRTEEYTGPPKEHLVEQYFHPDNLSSEEKLKSELKRVRDEFKMSESDCGSSRVQANEADIQTTRLKPTPLLRLRNHVKSHSLARQE
ncbi:hypothetical protein BVC80_9073g50 [Macleaya cordata]|uniref:Uncharacterized protein n=1 Tax=Macleaya cordata TaxID=56857 RepID=A0A200PTV6_MACCD|nr:hypothetical protein BVC80_9073g50 [Macleaya cordata]